MDWTDDKVFRLISLYESHPCLYNATNRDYHNRLAKRSALQKIAADMETTEIDISKKLKYLRSQFGEEMKKMKASKSGLSTDGTYISKWRYYTALSFLEIHINTGRQCVTAPFLEPSLFQQLTDAADITAADVEDAESASESQSTVEDIETPHSVPLPSRRKLPSGKRKRTQLTNDSTAVTGTLMAMGEYFVARSRDNFQLQQDADAVFGQMVGLEIRKIKDETSKMQLKKSIMDTVYNAQIAQQQKQHQLK